MRSAREALTASRRAPLLSALGIVTIAFSLFAFGLFGLVAMTVFVLALLVPFAYLLSVGALEWAPVRDVIDRMPGPLLRTRTAVLDPTGDPRADAEEAA